MAEGDARISLSEERLRAALAEMELRLRIYFDEQLKHKSDSTPVKVLEAKVDALDRGDFTDVHKRALAEFIEEHGAQREGRVWTRNERWFGALAVLLSLIAVTASLYFGIQATKTSRAPASESVVQGVTA